MKYVALLLLFGIAIAGCKSTTVDPVVYTQAISMSVKNLPTSRPGETYALWFGFPGGVAHAKTNDPQHSGTTKFRLISRFTIDSYGKLTGFDTNGVASRIGYLYAQAEQADISVESETTINDTLPAALLMVSDFSGTAHQGISAPSVTDPEALGYAFTSLSGAFTLTPSAGSGSGTDVFLMNATDQATTSPSLANLPELEEPWHYALWVVDTNATNPNAYYYGGFTQASGHDADSVGDAYAFPGGRMPADITMDGIDLRSGTARVVVTLEPGTFGSAPTMPFGLQLLSAPISSSATFFTPTTLTNTAVMPTASVIINR